MSFADEWAELQQEMYNNVVAKIGNTIKVRELIYDGKYVEAIKFNSENHTDLTESELYAAIQLDKIKKGAES